MAGKHKKNKRKYIYLTDVLWGFFLKGYLTIGKQNNTRHVDSIPRLKITFTKKKKKGNKIAWNNEKSINGKRWWRKIDDIFKGKKQRKNAK